MPYPKRLIEVDLPIKRISAHARREKTIRHGHISTLHIWWARRPLAACRAVLCASLWPDPADQLCPKEFMEFAKKEMLKWSDNNYLQLLSKESVEHFIKLNHNSKLVNNKVFLRQLLLDFIADFANWDNGTNHEYLKTARALTQSAHIALGGQPGTKPLVIDPFAGGGSIPLEALRIGADAFASDLNPIATLLNKVLLEFIPRYGKELINEVKKWGAWIKEEAGKELMAFYTNVDHEVPIAYLWSRTINCEGPDCGAKIPLLRTLKITKTGRKWYYVLEENKGREIKVSIKEGNDPNGKPTSSGGKAICPRRSCGYVTSEKSVKNQLISKNGGTNDAMLVAVYVESKKGKYFRPPTEIETKINESVKHLIDYNSLPDEEINPIRPYKNTRGLSAVTRIGLTRFRYLYTNRQILVLQCFQKHIANIGQNEQNLELRNAVSTILNFAASKFIPQNCSLARWDSGRSTIVGAFSKQALQVVSDFAEVNPFSGATGSWDNAIDWLIKVIEANLVINNVGTVQRSPAQVQLLPNEIANALITDPPYFAAIPYSDLSNVFYVWEREFIKKLHPGLYNNGLINQQDEIIVTNANYGRDGKSKTSDFFEKEMKIALDVARRVVMASGIGVIVFADSSTDSWEAVLKAIIDSGWCITGSWPIDTELQSRTQATNAASLQSSIHLVCRPREYEDGSLMEDQIGDWRDVQEELPKRIHEWMPRLAVEGVAGADAIFACLGPALEIFSRYTKVVHSGSEREISLREYLEKVWAAVSQEALNMVFSGGEAQTLEEDARLTAMWLWTLTAGASDSGNADDDDENDEEETTTTSGKITGGFTLEYDTARKIAQGLGANLEDLKTLIEVKGDKARLLPVMERANKLFGATGMQQHAVKKKKKPQLSLEFENVITEDDLKFEMPELKMEQTGKTVLDRLHQAMLLFSSGRSEALKRFLVEDGAGKDDRFWKLAQSLTSLYPKDTDERRWVEAVQTYKKSLGF
jgi:putative DNA methylase